MKSLHNLDYGAVEGLKRAAGDHWTVQRSIEKHYREDLQRMQGELWAQHAAEKRERATKRAARGESVADLENDRPDISTWPVIFT
jgi:hypothetical protein